MASTFAPPKPSPYQTRSRTLSSAKRKPGAESDHSSDSDSESEEESEATEDGYERDDELADDAAARVARWHQRGIARKETQRIPPGRYKVGAGGLSVTVSGMNRQRCAVNSRMFFGVVTLGFFFFFLKMEYLL